VLGNRPLLHSAILFALSTILSSLSDGVMCEIYAVPRKHFAFEPDDPQVLLMMSPFCGHQYRLRRYVKTQERQVRRSLVAVKRNGKAIAVLCRGGPWGCEALRFTHFVDSLPRYGGEVVSITSQPPFTRRKFPGSHIC
jgi:hypothetical protein